MFNNLYKYKKLLIGSSTGFIGIALYQGIQSRNEYVNNYKNVSHSPTGPRFGIERSNWMNKIKLIKNNIINKKDSLFDIEEYKLFNHVKVLLKDIKIKYKLMQLKTTDKLIDNKIKQKKKKIKLLLIGDSLATGVGCDSLDHSPVLPKVLAKVLSIALNREIEWYSAGIIGATAKDIRNQLIPNKKKEIMDIFNKETIQNDLENTKLVVVIVCGLNDWKHMLENFPNGMGLESFKSNLELLNQDIQELASTIGVQCDVFLPAIPINCTTTDPSCYFKARPLKDVVELINWFWDMQKQAVARDDKDSRTWFINVPALDSSFSTAGPGTVSKDRVHPSSQGYQWWATHIAAEILSVYDIDS